MKIENLKDLLSIDHEKLKAVESKRIIGKVKALIKVEHNSNLIENVNLPYKGVGIVGNKLVHLKFDLESKEAIVDNIEVNKIDIKGRNYMAGAKAIKLIKIMVNSQKEEVENENK